MSLDPWAGVPEILSRLEDRELPLLSWGIVDGFLSKRDVENVIDAQLDVDAAQADVPLHSVDGYLQRLLDTGLLHRLPDSTPKYRTRLAETLRLLRTLRQLWQPNDTSIPGWWRQSSSLVADYRLRVTPRRYPRRWITADDAVASLATTLGWSSGGAGVLKRMIGDGRLATFQVDATASILEGLRSPRLTGRIVTAGTGSGKTLAFYIPALLDIAATADVKRSGPHTLALYPRNELLRDQAREALLMASRVGGLNGAGTRPVRIGLLYGSTPNARDLDGNRGRAGWKRKAAGWAAPYFPCLTDGCLGQMVWLDTDRRAGNEQLKCDTCAVETLQGALAITRDSIRQHPPDILFSSTEMLSKQSTSSGLGRVLGWRGPTGTRMILLDETHTYSGVHGAQVGLMLRRWRHANRQWNVESPVIVGLSATLRDAGDFFSNLTGAGRSDVEVIAPLPEELEATSREYGIVLRGDPVSGTALLSTSIQTTMLVERMLDTIPGVYGSVTFAFTDDLDSINRLYDNLRDAEGHSPRGRARGTVLANLRSPREPQAGPRYLDGQSWDLPAHLQRLDRGLSIARTTSQDSGVDASADVVVATSSLEVGFNDPRVGAVIQHKAPRDLASFLQRRGRAGRRLAMRPLTVVVLSDYGRDRIAYQTYEKLLDPEIDARSLPINNRFVIKMQATHALLDWVSRRTGADTRKVLTPPKDSRWPKTDEVQKLLATVIGDASLQEELAEHLARALRLAPDEAHAALWEEPRSLILSVIPTALRRLESDWIPLSGQTDAGAIPWTPLPEYMTDTLFGALNTPDVAFDLPPNFGDDHPTMPISQALREAVPGRVRRRYGYAHASLSTWLSIPDAGSGLPLNRVVAKGHALGQWSTSNGETFTVVRPLALKLVAPPRAVADTSNAQPLWRSAFEVPETALYRMDLPTPSVWSSLIRGCSFALHVGGGPLRVRRMAIGSDGELTNRDGSTMPLHVRYEHGGLPAALGFELDVDAMVIDGALPSNPRDYLGDFSESPVGRTLLFRRVVLEDERLDDVANAFQRQWLTEGYLHAYVQAGLSTDDVKQVPADLTGGRWSADLQQFLTLAYRADNAGQLGQTRTLTALTALAANPLVQSVIEEHARLLVAADVLGSTSTLLDRVFVDTIANAVLTAAEEALSDSQDGDLAVDVVLSPYDRSFRILVSETSIGGLGLMEKLHRDYALDPRRFWDSVTRATTATEAEDVDESMQSIVAALISPDNAISRGVHKFRAADGIDETDGALRELLASWTDLEGPPSHLLVSTLAARMLRPGSSTAIDQIVAALTAAWVREERRLGIEIDARTLTYHASRGQLGVDLGPLSADAAFSLLWLRGPQARSQRLEHWHPYQSNVTIERRIVEHVVRQNTPVVDVTKPDWVVKYSRVLESNGRVLLSSPYISRTHLATGLRIAVVTPVERNGLRTYARVIALRQRNGVVLAELSLAEELQ
ncbi:protein DpdJ [Microbacterium profundi]|uniref:protein DpdJ n=1 Tax=Microbacterium profundi TaxID=450380 RepID=UPI00051A81E5|nr:protein DpdJ [Microbacterium profundi]